MLVWLGLAAVLVLPQDSVRVQATLSASRITAGGSTVLSIVVETGGATPGEIPVPTLPAGLDLGPISDFSQLQIAFPGGRRRITRREIVIFARAPGQYRIPSVRVPVGSGAYATPTLDLGVLPGGARGGGAAPPGVREDVRMRAWLSADTVYSGQQVLYRAEALFPEELRLRHTRAPVFAPPATTGFWVYDLPDPVNVALRVIGDAAYEVQSFRQVLFPLHAGTQEIPPARLQYELRSGPVFSPEARELTSQPLTLHVLPLPELDRPAAFAGAVGSYSMRALLSATRAGVGEAVRLVVRLEGSGNLKAIPRPQLGDAPGLEVYPGAERVDTGFDGERVTGRREFEWLLVPQESGRLRAPSATFAWFDPETGRYHQASSAALELEVSGVAAAAHGEGLAPIRTRSARSGLAWTRTPVFLALQLVPLLVGVLLLGRGRRWRRTAGSSAAGPSLGDALRALRAERLQPKPCLERLGSILQRAESTGESAALAEIRGLRDRVRAALYAPQAPTLDDCETLLAEGERLLGRTSGGRRAPAGLSVLPLLVATGSVLAQATPLADGVRAYQAGQPEVAVRSFAAAVRAAPDDAAAWYDLGNALHVRGEGGAASWAWLRALQLQPRAGDAQHNLRVAGAGRAAVALAPRVPLSGDELRLAAALLWWLLAGMLLLGLSRSHRSLLIASLVPAALLVIAASLLAVRASQEGTRAIVLQATSLRIDPVLRSDVAAELAAGTPVRIRDQRGDWVRAIGEDLQEGWVERRALGRL